MFDFGEKQGRLVVKIDLYLKRDLTNEELKKVYDELEFKFKHPLVADWEISPVTN